MNRGDVWLTQIGRKARPVLVLTREAVLDVRELVTVAEITTTRRGLSTEVALEHETVGLSQPSVVNSDGLYTIRRSSLTRKLGAVNDDMLHRVCEAVSTALGC